MVARPIFLYVLAFAILAQLPSTALAQTSDGYAIYSGLIEKSPAVRTGPGNVPTEDELFLIESTTATSRTGFGPSRGPSNELTESCVKVPTADTVAFSEILADYNSRKDKPVTLARQFTFTRPYQLLPTKEIDQFLKDAMDATPQALPAGFPPPVNRNPLFQKSKKVFRLGDVYFNSSRSFAMVYFSVFTTPLDGSGGWRAFRKSASGQWEENRSWATCGWGSGR
jgi:hypothetical protein